MHYSDTSTLNYTNGYDVQSDPTTTETTSTTRATATAATTFNIEHPTDPTNASIHSQTKPTSSYLTQKLRGGLLFLVSTTAIALLFVASQFVAFVTQEHTTEDTVVLGYRSGDQIDLFFTFAVLSALMQFVVNAGGGSKTKYWHSFFGVTMILFILLTSVVPDVYQQVNNDTKVRNVDRGGCSSVLELDTKFNFQEVCLVEPLDSFLRYDFDERTSNIKGITDGAEFLQSLAKVGILAQEMTMDSDSNKYHGFLTEKCSPYFFDSLCSELYRKCRKSDCRPPSPICFNKNQVDSWRLWLNCGRQESCEKDPKLCDSMNDSDSNLVAELVPQITTLMQKQQKYVTVKLNAHIPFFSSYPLFFSFLLFSSLRQVCR